MKTTNVKINDTLKGTYWLDLRVTEIFTSCAKGCALSTNLIDLADFPAANKLFPHCIQESLLLSFRGI